MQRIITIYEFSDSEIIRVDCLKSINSVSISNEKLFEFLEEIVISEPNAEIRLFAMRIILNKYPDKGYGLVDYLFKSNEANEFIMKIANLIGETLFLSEENFQNQFSDLFKEKILEIFIYGDVISFELLWGDWCYSLPEEFWRFLLDLKSLGGVSELVDYFINDKQIFNWFFKTLFEKFSLDQWLRFLEDSRFSGRLLFLLFYLEKEKPADRFYQLLNIFENVGRELNTVQKNAIINLLRKNNPYILTLILMLNWLENFDSALLEKILEDTNLDLTYKIKELIISSQFDFLKYDSLVYSLISFLLHLSKDIDETYLKQFFNAKTLKILEELLPILHSFLKNTPIKSSSKAEKTYVRKYKASALEFLKILSRNFDIRVVTS